MFDIGWSELVVIAVVALIVIGPKELPGVLRTLSQYMGKIRRMAAEFQGQFQEAMREAEMADLKKQVDEITDTAKGLTDFDPLANVRKEVESFTADPLGTASAASPEAVAQSVAGPVAPEAAIPMPDSVSPQADVAIAAEGERSDAVLGTAMTPQPQTEIKSGSGA
jgi:sec-independent protein translocase protein TatB